ncbi:MAG: hypothetical protein EBS90_14090 [Betaproteobacteria bacterium]|nr:hypothetical protein [Betaproteobacteria bacterium]
MANAASLIDVCLAFEKEERRREKKQEALELEWLALDNAQEVLDAQQEAEQQEAKEPESKEAERARRSAEFWKGAWVVAETKRKR